MTKANPCTIPGCKDFARYVSLGVCKNHYTMARFRRRKLNCSLTTAVALIKEEQKWKTQKKKTKFV